MILQDLIADIFSNRDLATVMSQHGGSTSGLAVDLHDFTPDEWEKCCRYHRLALPTGIATFLDGHTPSMEEKNLISEALEKFYDVTAPFFVNHTDEPLEFFLDREP